MPITETRIASYLTGVSIRPNIVDTFRSEEYPEPKERYICVLSLSFETKYDNGKIISEPSSLSSWLVDPESGLDYKLSAWGVIEIAKAMPIAFLNCVEHGKIKFAGFDPSYPQLTITEE